MRAQVPSAMKSGATLTCSEGRLYDWSTAMNGASSSEENPSGVQGLCPDGWHLPSDLEWKQLVEFVELMEQSTDNFSEEESIPVELLKSEKYGGTDAYNFSTLGGFVLILKLF